MTPLVLAVSIVGALAVLSFIVFLVLAVVRGRRDATARVALWTAGALGIVCAVIGIAIAFVQP